jgi:hypothetical protein
MHEFNYDIVAERADFMSLLSKNTLVEGTPSRFGRREKITVQREKGEKKKGKGYIGQCNRFYAVTPPVFPLVTSGCGVLAPYFGNDL